MDGYNLAFELKESCLQAKIYFKNVYYFLPVFSLLTLLHSEWPKLHRVSAILSAIGLKNVADDNNL